MFLKRIVFASILIAAVTVPAHAQSPSDVRCLLLSNAFAAAANKDAAKGVAQASVWYFMGKIDGRMSASELRDAMARERKTLKTATAGSEMRACASRMQQTFNTMRTSMAAAK